MRLYEFDDRDPLRVKLMAVTNQLKEKLKGSPRTWSTDELLDFLKINDIVLDKSDLFDIVKKEPLVNIIDNVNDDQVIFKGQEKEVPQAPKPVQGNTPDHKKTIQQLASKQAKKL
jgi:hypothetical protein